MECGTNISCYTNIASLKSRQTSFISDDSLGSYSDRNLHIYLDLDRVNSFATKKKLRRYDGLFIAHSLSY